MNELKIKQAVKMFIKNGMNGTATIRELEPELNTPARKHYAQVKAVRMMHNVKFKQSLMELMEEKGLNKEIITKIHLRNLKQKKNISASNEAINIFHKLEGNFAPEKQEKRNINISLDSSEVLKRLNEVQEEIRELTNES